ncbi:unnamed protein product [Durusdinium trenchii]|uniref:Uncharacterized protein n=2 Tax=Durusdinium trenchii TaxID=1381693 RepID=A0ABP0K2E0_9DINO
MLSASDPYYVAKEEVAKAMEKLQGLHQDWKRSLQAEDTARSHRFQQLHEEITGELEQLGLDLDDIHATISMVEGNRSKFQVSDGELASRKRFANDCHKTLEELQKDRGNVERLLRGRAGIQRIRSLGGSVFFGFSRAARCSRWLAHPLRGLLGGVGHGFGVPSSADDAWITPIVNS